MNYNQLVDTTISLGAAWHFERQHALRVSRLALRLFDQLQPLHGMGNTERIWLRTAALLHDVGKRQDPRRHHKVARDIILKASALPLRRQERVMVGLIARYHRGPLPSLEHSHFRDLDPAARCYVVKLAALLRLADGLDKGRVGLVEDLRCGVEAHSVKLTVFSRGILPARKAQRKADLFDRTFDKRVVVDVEAIHHCLGFCLDSTTEMAYAQSA